MKKRRLLAARVVPSLTIPKNTKENTMGLFDFVKDAGKKLSTQISTQMDLGKEIQHLGIKIEDQEILFDNGIVKVKGKVKTQEDREKVILALGNVDGVKQVNDSLEVMEKVEKPGAEFYTVKSGDSLSKIAKQFYGDAKKYPLIFEANKPMLTDPNKIYPGQTLRIPKEAIPKV